MITKIKKFILVERNASDYILDNAEDIKNALKQLRSIHKTIETLQDFEGEDIPEPANTLFKKIENILSKYDNYIEQIVFSTHINYTADQLVDMAIENEYRNGTEPFFIDAIDSIYHMLNREGVLKESASISALSNYLFTFDKYCKDKNENPEVTARAREFIEYLRKNKSEELQQWLLGNTSSTTNLQAMLRTFPGWKGFGDNSKEGLLNFNAFSLLDTVSLYNKSSWKFEKNEVDMYANDYTEDDSYPHDFVLSDGRFLFLVEQDFGDMAGETNYYYRYFVSDTEDIKDAKEINYKEAAALLSPEDKTELERIKNSLADENTNRSRAFVEKRKVQENKKIIDDLPGNPFRKKNKKFEEGEIVWDSGNKRYGVILKIYNDTDDEVRLDSDGMQPVENLFKLGSPNDKGTKADLIECLKSHKRLIDEWPKNYERIKY